jgi:hypothetical protein
MATRRQIERKLTELISRLDDAGSDVHGTLGEALPEPRTIRVDVTDLGLTYWTELARGRMGELHQGEPPEAHIRIEATGDHLIEMIDGTRSLFSAYLGGQIKIEASFSDLMRLRKLA